MDSSDTEFYLIENGSFVLVEQLRSEVERYVDIYYFSGDKQITGAEYSAMLQKYTDGTQLLKVSYEDVSIERGLLPIPEIKENGPVVQPPPSGSNTLPADGSRIVFTGTVNRYTYDEVLLLQGEANPNPYADHSDESFLLIILDMPQTMELGYFGGGTRSGTVSMISVFNSDEPWLPPELEQYKGPHLILSIDPSRTLWPSSTDLPLGEPHTDDVHVLGQASN